MLLLETDEERFYAQPGDKIEGFGRFLKRVWPYRWILLEAIAVGDVEMRSLLVRGI